MRKAILTGSLILGLSASPTSGQRPRDPAPAPAPAPAPSALPELKLNVPGNIRLSRSAKFTLDPIVAPEHASYTIQATSIDWVLVQKANVVDPLENDLYIDRLDGTEASIPTGASPSVISVNVTAHLYLKDADGKEHFEKIKTHQDVQFGNPLVDPVTPPSPGPGPAPGPGPGPSPTPPAPVIVDPTLPDGKYKLAAWTYKTLKDSRAQPAPIAITKAEAAAIANGWRQVAQMTRNNAQITPEQVISNMAEANRNNAGKNLDNWIGVFFEPVRVKLNSLNRIVTGPTDQATSYEEIANGLEAWSKMP